MNLKNIFKFIRSRSKQSQATEVTSQQDFKATRQNFNQNKHQNKVTTKHVVHEKITTQGWQTQFEDVDENTHQPIHVIIGLDFGTAFTKVVISGAGQKYGIPVNDTETSTNKYLLPTRLYQDSAGHLTVTQPENCHDVYTDFKMRILDNNLNIETRNYIVTYLGWVLQKSRKWLMTEKQAVFRNNYLKWEVNIGLPTEKYENSELQKTYCEIVSNAWYESTKPVSGCENSVKPNNAAHKLHPTSINALPEFAAQIQSYISSPQRKIGVHTLVDVGAGTIDATGFIVHRDEGENRHPILSKSVKKLGTTYLAQHCCNALGQSNGWQPSPQELLPSPEEFANKFRVPLEKITEVNDQFKSKIQPQINSILRKAHDKAPFQEEWRTGLPFMLCGGGTRVDFYKEFYSEEIINILKSTKHGRALKETSLPELDKLDAPDLLNQDRDRLSVAYGLSFDESNIGKIMRVDKFPSDSENVGHKNSKCSLCNGSGGLYSLCHRCGGSGFV